MRRNVPFPPVRAGDKINNEIENSILMELGNKNDLDRENERRANNKARSDKQRALPLTGQADHTHTRYRARGEVENEIAKRVAGKRN